MDTLLAKQRALGDKITALKEKLDAQKKKEAFLAVRLVLSSAEACETAVEMEYAECSAKWVEVYEVHTSADSPELSVVSRARMTQNTSEDWENVRVSLYTGNPGSSQSIPVLGKLRLQFKVEEPPIEYRRSAGMAMPMARAASVSENTAPAMAAAPVKQMVMEEVAATDAETMTGYLLPGRRTIVSGTVGTMADLKKDVIPAEKRILCIPKLDHSAYLTAVVKTADWPLKPAAAKIYLNQNYCGEVYAAPNPAEEEFLLSLGRDERITSSRESVRVKTENVLLKGQKKQICEFSLHISNLSEQSQKVRVWDQIPVSTEKQIVVEQVESNGAVLDPETGKLYWDLTLNGKQTVEKRLSYVITYPKDKALEEIQIRPAPIPGAIPGTRSRAKTGPSVCTVCGALSRGGDYCLGCGRGGRKVLFYSDFLRRRNPPRNRTIQSSGSRMNLSSTILAEVYNNCIRNPGDRASNEDKNYVNRCTPPRNNATHRRLRGAFGQLQNAPPGVHFVSKYA